MAKKGFVSNLLYGKQNKNDFTNSMLPSTRRQQFGYIIKNNFLRLFNLNLILFAFFLPFIFFYLISTIYISNQMMEMEESQIILELFPMLTFKHVVLIPLLMLGFIGISGVVYILRKMAFDEVISVKKDFKKGVKDSYKQFLFIGFLFGLIIFAYEYASQYVLLMNMNDLLKVIIYISVVIIYFALIISVMYMINLSSLYVINNFMLVKSALLITIKELFKNFAVFFITFIPIFIWLMFSYIFLNFTTLFALLIFGFIYILLSFTELSMFSFDKYINIKQYPDFVRKGLSNNG